MDCSSTSTAFTPGGRETLKPGKQWLINLKKTFELVKLGTET
jgi:hypothetical protein